MTHFGRFEATPAPGDTVSVIDTANNTVVATVPGLHAPYSGLVHPDGSRLYVTNTGTIEVPGDTVSVIDTTTNSLLAAVQVESRPRGIALVTRD